MSIQTGDSAPGFALPSKPGEMVDIGEFIGRDKIVLLFFPLAFSSVCTEEMCYFRDHWTEWEPLNARVFGICVDSPFVTEKFRQEENIPFPILSDFNREVSALYGALHEELRGLKGVTKRAAFVIAEDGIITYAWVSEDPSVQVNFEEVKAAVRGDQEG